MNEKEEDRLARNTMMAVASIYVWIDGNKRLLHLWRMFGKEVLDEAVTNVIEKCLIPRCVDPVKPQRFEIKRTARTISAEYIRIRRQCHPVSEFFWDVVGKILGWPKEMPAGVRLFR